MGWAKSGYYFMMIGIMKILMNKHGAAFSIFLIKLNYNQNTKTTQRRMVMELKNMIENERHNIVEYITTKCGDDGFYKENVVECVDELVQLTLFHGN